MIKETQVQTPQLVAAGLAGIGALIVVVGGGLTQSAPDLHNAVRAVGLLSMLFGAATLLVAKNYPRRGPRTRRRTSAATGTRETGRNLIIAGLCFMAGALAMLLSLRLILTGASLCMWALGACMLLGFIAILIGLGMYVTALVQGAGQTPHRQDDPG